jgi:hypothetical protein
LISLKERKALSTLLIIIIVVAVVVIALASVIIFLGSWFSLTEVTGSGELITQQKDFSDFSAIDISSGFEAEISQSNSYSISIIADDNVLDYIQISKSGSTLNVGVQRGISYQSVTLKIEIEMPELSSLEFSGATSGTITDFSSPESFVVELSGASNLEMQNIHVEDVDVELSGASNLIAEGSGNNLIAMVSGASNLDFTNFPVVNSDLNVSGASKATVDLDGTLDAVVSGASTIYYIVEPTMRDITISDSSTIEKK